MNRKIIILLIGITLLFTALSAEKIKDFTLQDADGNDVNLYEILNAGNVVVLDFWATWCIPCCKALPHLNRFHEEHDNVVVIAVSEDSKRSIKKAAKYIEKNGYTFTTLFDPDGAVKKLLGVKVMPETFYILPDGEIYFHHVGYKEGEEIGMEEELNALLESLETPQQPQE
jgi:peroxiredoxin